MQKDGHFELLETSAAGLSAFCNEIGSNNYSILGFQSSLPVGGPLCHFLEVFKKDCPSKNLARRHFHELCEQCESLQKHFEDDISFLNHAISAV
jgi:hypothetical protein